MIAFSVGVPEDTVKALAGVSPVMREDILKGCQKPKIIVHGTVDSMIPAEQIKRETSKAAGPVEVRMIEGADHFWWGFEEQLAEIVANFFVSRLANNS
jgi:alpha/beta superfamily hydrolase